MQLNVPHQAILKQQQQKHPHSTQQQHKITKKEIRKSILYNSPHSTMHYTQDKAGDLIWQSQSSPNHNDDHLQLMYPHYPTQLAMQSYPCHHHQNTLTQPAMQSPSTLIAPAHLPFQTSKPQSTGQCLPALGSPHTVPSLSPPTSSPSPLMPVSPHQCRSYTPSLSITIQLLQYMSPRLHNAQWSAIIAFSKQSISSKRTSLGHSRPITINSNTYSISFFLLHNSLALAHKDFQIILPAYTSHWTATFCNLWQLQHCYSWCIMVQICIVLDAALPTVQKDKPVISHELYYLRVWIQHKIQAYTILLPTAVSLISHRPLCRSKPTESFTGVFPTSPYIAFCCNSTNSTAKNNSLLIVLSLILNTTWGYKRLTLLKGGMRVARGVGICCWPCHEASSKNWGKGGAGDAYSLKYFCD